MKNELNLFMVNACMPLWAINFNNGESVHS